MKITILQWLIEFGVLYTLWLHYIVAMALLRAKDEGKLTKAMRVLGMPAMVVAFILDVFSNIFICTLLFTELPKEWTVSARLTRYFNEGKAGGWKYKVANWVLSQLLDGIDPSGKHRSKL